MAKAHNDPRAFFMDQPPIAAFVAGLQEAVQLSKNQGSCLQDGHFQGYGCLDLQDGKQVQVCKCGSMFDWCNSPSSPDSAISMWTEGHKKQAESEVLAYLLGQCYVPTWLPYLLCAVTCLVLVVVFLLVRMCMGGGSGSKPRGAPPDGGGPGG